MKKNIVKALVIVGAMSIIMTGCNKKNETEAGKLNVDDKYKTSQQENKDNKQDLNSTNKEQEEQEKKKKEQENLPKIDKNKNGISAEIERFLNYDKATAKHYDSIIEKLKKYGVETKFDDKKRFTSYDVQNPSIIQISIVTDKKVEEKDNIITYKMKYKEAIAPLNASENTIVNNVRNELQVDDKIKETEKTYKLTIAEDRESATLEIE